MPTPQDYILTFDFTSFTSQFNFLTKSYTDFGDTLHKLSAQVTTDLKGIQEQANTLFQTLSNLGMVSETGFSSFERHLKQTSTYLDDYQKKSAEISQKLKDISTTDITKLSSALGGGQDISDKLSDIGDRGNAPGESSLKESAETMKKNVDDVMSKMEELDKKFEGVDKKLEQFFKDIWAKVEAEGRQAKAKAQGIASQLTGGMFSGGGILGMALAFVLMGEQEKQRRGAETGEMRNVFEAGTVGITGKSQQEAITHFSEFQEKASHLYGIGKDEFQSLTKQFVDSGYEMTKSLGYFKNELGEVGENVVQTTLGLDKLYNMATGTSAQNVNKLVSDFGESLSGASQKYVELAFAAQRSGMGVEKFINSVMSGSQALSQYGIEMTDIKDVMQSLQKYYKDMGLGDQTSGAMAARSLAGMAAAPGRVSGQLEYKLAEMMFPSESKAEAVMQYEAGFERIKSGKDVGYFQKLLKTQVKLLSDMGKGDKAAAYQYNMSDAHIFPDYQSFSAAWDLVMSGKIDSKEKVDKDELDKQMKSLSEAYKTEGEQLTELQKNQYGLLQGLSTIGQGITKILGGILGTLITGFYWLYSLPSRLMMSGEDKEKADEKIAASFKAAADAMSGGWTDIVGGKDNWGGLGQVGTALKGIFGDMFAGAAPAVDLLKGGVSGTVDQLMEDMAELAVSQRRQEEVMLTMVDSMQSIAPLLAKMPGGDAYGVQLANLKLALEADLVRRTSQGGETERRTRAQKFIQAKVKESPNSYKIKGIISAEHLAAAASMSNGYYHGMR